MSLRDQGSDQKLLLEDFQDLSAGEADSLAGGDRLRARRPRDW